MSVREKNRKYKRVTIYFSSGTGNSYRVAKWFYETCLAKDIRSELIPVNSGVPAKEIGASPEHLVALVFPTHGLMPPWSVIKFLFRMPRRKKTHFLNIPTRGSLYAGPLLIPGAAGLASFLPALILLFKEYCPRGSVSFDMPVNMTSIHPTLTPKHANRVVAAAKRKSEKYFERFFRNNSLWLTRNNLYELIWTLPLLYFIPLFPILYLIVGRFFMGKILFANDNCIGCGTCVKSCPAGALIMKNGKKEENKRPYWRYNCEHCLRCLNFCPQKAVVAGHSWGALLWYIGVLVAYGGALYTWIGGHIPQLLSLRSWWTIELLNAIFYYPAFIAAYFLFFQLLRLKPINTFFTLTSLVRFFGQYREPDTTLNKMTHGEKP
ncbi:MAG: EFR1 family ferrodoxin [Candidatus Aminicenantes bacterium]|jgi:ferredoxin